MLDYWRGLRGNPDEIDRPVDSPIFIEHGTGEETLELSQTTDITVQCEEVAVTYELYAIATKGHAVWNKVKTNFIDGMLLVRRTSAFTCQHLQLGTLAGFPIVPTGINTTGLDFTGGDLTFYFQGERGISYEVFVSQDLESRLKLSGLGTNGCTVEYRAIPSGGTSTIVVNFPDPFASLPKLFLWMQESPARSC
ncbi:MAG: hypothetical protein AAGD22_00380 [Verrucomicrobiota bacterium]